MIASLDLAPMLESEADQVLQAARPCTLRRSRESDPILWAASDGSNASA